MWDLGTASHDPRNPRAVFAADRIHALRAVPGIILENSAACLAATKAIGLAEIFHAIAQIGIGIVEMLHLSTVTDTPGGARHDLHEADLTGPAPGTRPEVGFDLDDRKCQFQRHAIGAGVLRNQAAIARARTL